MKKILIFLFAFCFLLTGCNKKQEDSSSSSSSSSSSEFYTNEEIRQKLKSSAFEFKSRVQDKTQFTLNGEFNAPDSGFEGMFVYKDLSLSVDSQLLNPYIRLKSDVYLKENNIVNDVPDKRIDIIKQNEKANSGTLPNLDDILNILRPSYEYVLEEYIDNTNKYYSKTVDPTGSAVFSGVVGALSEMFKEFEIDDIPKSIKFSYDRENASYGMKIKFKDLEGTPLIEYMNILLSFVPELNELMMQFKDEITINLNNIKLDTPVSTFDVDIVYPAMQGMFEFEVIHGSFNVNFKPFIKEDVTKLKIKDTYLKGRLGANIVNNYLEPFENNNRTLYKVGLVVDTISALDITKLDLENPDILALIKNKKIKIVAPGADSIKYFDRYSKEPIDVVNNILELSILDKVLIEVVYPNSNPRTITIENVTEIKPNSDEENL